jgi:DNA-binding response OmpR family regulator
MQRTLGILAVDNEAPVAQLLALVLSKTNRLVMTASDGQDALTKIALAAQPVDIVTTDHRMPRKGGVELVRALREQSFRGKIMVLSAHLSDADMCTYTELKVDLILSKPFDVVDLQRSVDQLAFDIDARRTEVS